MKKFFSVLLSIIFALCLLFTLVLSVVRFNFSTSKITELAGQVLKTVAVETSAQFQDDGLFHIEDRIISNASYGDYDLGGFDINSIDLSNMDINEIVQSYLDANDIDVDPEVVADILASPEITETVSLYADEIINYVTGASEEIKIDPAHLTNVVNKAIDKYEEATGEVVDRTGLEESIAEGIEMAVPELTATLDTAKEENAEVFDIIKKVNLVLSLKVWIICLAVCAVLAIIILLINRNIFVWFKYISIPAIVDGLLIFIAVLVAKGIVPEIMYKAITDAGISEEIYAVIRKYVIQLLTKLQNCGFVSTILGVILLTLGITLGKKKAVAVKEPEQVQEKTE